jgi:uncharacterized repeat protein (TIGR03803 family)
MLRKLVTPSSSFPPFAYSLWVVTYAVLILMSFALQSQAQTFKTLYPFTGADSGNSAFPGWVTLAQGRNGSLYGTTVGESNGSVFDVSTQGLFTNLFDFDGTDGGLTYAGVRLASDGNYYGVTFNGGSGYSGVFFQLTPGGTYTVLHTFSGNNGGSDGTSPMAAPVEASDGNLYGTTRGISGFTPVVPTIYKYTHAGVFSTIYQFPSTVGELVFSSLIEGNDGDLYGTADFAAGENGCGTIFKMSMSGVVLQYYALPSGVDGPCGPMGPLFLAADGNFYGTTEYGGTYNIGTIFKMTPAFVVSTLYSFQGYPTDGANPSTSLVQATDGNLYGTATDGEGTDYGTLFQISTSGVFKLLYVFDPTTGDFPLGALTQHTNGRLYGTLLTDGPGCGCGQIYSLDMGLGPFITFVRSNGKAGQMAQILGQGFTGATNVTFNGIPSTTFFVASPTYIRAVIPSGATTGPVVVTTPSSTLSSNKNFRIVP